MQDSLHKALREAVSKAKCPGGVAYVGAKDETYFFEAEGRRQVTPKPLPAERLTVYDLASLTKVIATTTAVMLLRDDGVLALDQPVSEHIPVPSLSRFTIRNLLTHTSGLYAWHADYKDVHSVTEFVQRCADIEPDWEPGTRRRYSDPGFLLLGMVVELASRDSLDAFCRKRIFEPLGMKDTTFNPPPAMRERCAATAWCSWRGRVMRGEVHDENAYAVGGVSGHAGLFSTAPDVARFCRTLLAGELLKETTLAEMTRLGQVACYPWQGLGWQLDPWRGGPQGYLPSRAAFGHTGWTGTSMWMDRDTGLFAILLGNTCHPDREHRDSETFRRTFYDGVAARFYPGRGNTHTGLDRLVLDDFAPLREKRIALLTHHAAVDELGRPILDVLKLAPDVHVKVVYSPEHGLRGQAEAGESVGGQTAPGMEVISLYGRRRRPSRDELAGVDLFVVDLQDVGARYYTYPATMRECLAACGEAGTPVLLLDRPNPLGGAVIEGPAADEAGSPVCYAHIPVRHGMTLGELATLFLAREWPGPKPALTVHPLDGWTPDFLFDSCSLPWLAPSPNIPTPETALVYIGMCLFEGTNLNEGRGTDTPFQLIGAPWLRPDVVLKEVEAEWTTGLQLTPDNYTPRAIPGKAIKPRYKDETCQGIRIDVTDPGMARPFTLAVALIQAIRRVHPAEFAWNDHFDALAGGPGLRRGVERGEGVRHMARQWREEIEAFEALRPQLYKAESARD